MHFELISPDLDIFFNFEKILKWERGDSIFQLFEMDLLFEKKKTL